MNSLYLALRSLAVGDERPLARQAQRAALRRKEEAELADAAAFAMAWEAKPGRVLLGRWRDPNGASRWIGLPSHELLSTHAWILGSTGSGKSYFALSTLLQVLAEGRRAAVLVDMKGELASLVRQVVLPRLIRTGRGCRLLEHLRIIRPFDSRFVPELRITLPEPGVPREIQAFAIASAIEDALGDEFGLRMDRVLLMLALLAIERNEPLSAVQEWLESPRAFEAAARESGEPAVREYAGGTFAREARQSVSALSARLSLFLFLKETRLALAAPSCVSFAEALDWGLTIVDLGDPPAGAERAARFWAGVLVGRLTRAALSRRLTDRSRQTWIIFEEFQEALGIRQADQFQRLLALARHKKLALWFVNQQVAQLDSTLVKLLRTNTDLQVIFRSSLDDAKAIAHALPCSRDPRKASAERQKMLEEISRLPTRHCYLWRKPYRAQLIRSPLLNLPALRRAEGDLPADIRCFLDRGIVAVRRDRIERDERRQHSTRQTVRPHPLTFVKPEPSAALSRLG